MRDWLLPHRYNNSDDDDDDDNAQGKQTRGVQTRPHETLKIIFGRLIVNRI